MPEMIEVEAYRRLSIPFVAMVRPRAGDFVYGSAELAVMLRDAQLLLDAGAQGVVVGCLTSSGLVDTKACEQFVALAGESETIFHRAFDRIRDQLAALETLMDLGFTRVLTSGGAPTALQGARKIRSFVQRAAGRIEILPAGGIRENNVEAVVTDSRGRPVHGLGAGAALPSLPAPGVHPPR